MTKRNLLLVSLLLVFGLGVMVPVALAQAPTQGNGTVLNVAPSLYTVRPNSIGDAVGPVFLNFSSGYGTVAGGEVFTITYSQPIVGASGISKLDPGTAAAEFCDDSNATGLVGAFCSAMSYSASGNTLTLTNGTSAFGGWTGGYITIWGIRVSTVGVVPGSFITATVGAALNQSYPISFGSTGQTVAPPVNVGLVANTSSGGSLSASSTPTSILTCIGTGGAETYFTVSVTEQWAGAWTSLSDELVLAPYAPTSTKLVTNGSNISITLSGIPLGVTVTPYDISNDPGSQTWGAPTPTSYTGTMANDSVTFDFPLMTTVRQEVEGVDIEFEVTTTGPIASNNPPLTASVTLNPMTPTSKAEYPAFTYPVGTLAEEPNYPLSGVTFIGCQTSLLYPYVTNYVGGSAAGAIGNWDTALEVANTTSDPFGPGSNSLYLFQGGATPQDGSCTFYVYSAGTATSPRVKATEATPISFTTPVVLSGGTWSFMLSNTPAAGLLGGYAIATCNFSNAVGYAETVDNAGLGSWGVIGSYLPYVIPNPYIVGRNWNAIEGEFAITPWPYFDYVSGAPSNTRLRQLRGHK